MQPALSCTGVSKSFEQYVVPSKFLQDHVIRWRTHRKRWHHQALRNIDFELKPGEWVGIIGPNGSGKTTLLRILAGLMLPDAGTVHREGNISCFFELGVGFHPDRCAEENLHLHGILQGMSPREVRELMPQIFAFADVDTHRDVPIKCYSVGMRMRLAFAAAAYVDSDLYMFDEVFAVGDPSFQRKCIDRLTHMKRIGKSAILVGQSPIALSQICDRVLTLEQGSFVSEEFCSERARKERALVAV